MERCGSVVGLTGQLALVWPAYWGGRISGNAAVTPMVPVEVVVAVLAIRQALGVAKAAGKDDMGQTMLAVQAGAKANRRSGGTRPDWLMCRHVFPPAPYRPLRGTKTSGTRFPGGCLLARRSNKGVGGSHLGNPDSNKEKQIWVIREKKTKARRNNRKKPSVI
jgi:hypothetical protein